MTPDQVATAAALGELLRGAPSALLIAGTLIAGAKGVWIWGHEHRRIVADRDARYAELLARTTKYEEIAGDALKAALATRKGDTGRGTD